MRVFFTFVLLIWAGMHVYVFWRASSVPWIARHIGRPVLWTAASLLSVSYIGGRLLNHGGANATLRILEVLGADWIGVLFLLFVCMLAVDVVTLSGFLLPRVAASMRGWALISGVVLSAVGLVQGLRAPVVDTYEVQLPGLPVSSDGAVLVFASDFHLGTMLGKDWLAARVDQIQAQHPDIIVLGGDILEGDDPSEIELLTLFRRLSAPLGVWAVTGNHEFHESDLARNSGLLEQAGFHMLHDEWAEAKPGLIVAGVDDLTSRRRYGDTASFVAEALANHPLGAAVVFISHTPWDVDTAASAGAGLMLASHTHDGQIWPFGYLVQLGHPFLAGRYNEKGMSVIVCRGTGTWGPRMRLWRRGEIVRIVLRSSHKG